MQTILQIPYTLEVIKNCWKNAESELRSLIKEKHPDLDEEFITRLFYGEFSFSVHRVSKKGDISKAFLNDLEQAFRNLGYPGQLDVFEGLIAEVSLHKREIEKFTGGDFGLTIIRPIVQISQSYSGQAVFTIDEYPCGLLCQAKIRRRNGNWGKLSKRQKDVFPDRIKFLGLLLYSYSDEDRHKLNKFEWQLCQDASLSEVEDWLKSNKFPDTKSSGEIISLLGNACIGTDDPEIIEKNIRPKTKPNLCIRIFWPPDKYPGNEVRISLSQQVKQKQKQYVHTLKRFVS
jgi:hypothetical protein